MLIVIFISAYIPRDGKYVIVLQDLQFSEINNFLSTNLIFNN